jgi:hypothetical protein
MMNNHFECDNIGKWKEYIGRKIKNREGDNRILIVQLVIIRSFIDEFVIKENPRIDIPASRSDSFSPVMDGDGLYEVDQNCYLSGVGKLLYLSRCSYHDIKILHKSSPDTS